MAGDHPYSHEPAPNGCGGSKQKQGTANQTDAAAALVKEKSLGVEHPYPCPTYPFSDPSATLARVTWRDIGSHSMGTAFTGEVQYLPLTLNVASQGAGSPGQSNN